MDNLSIVVSNTYVEDLRIILERYSSSIEVEKVTSDTRCLSEDIEKIINDNNLEPKILRHPLRLSLLSGIFLGIILSIILYHYKEVVFDLPLTAIILLGSSGLICVGYISSFFVNKSIGASIYINKELHNPWIRKIKLTNTIMSILKIILGIIITLFTQYLVENFIKK